MNRKVNINIKKEDTIFIDGKTGQRLTKKEFAQKHSGVKGNLKNILGQNGTDNEEKPRENGEKKEN